MMTNLFVSRDCLGLLEERGKIRLKGNLLTILPEKSVFRLMPAFRFLKVLEGADDWRMVGRVLTLLEVTRLNGRADPERIDFGERSYEVQPGYVGEVMGTRQEDSAPGPQAAVDRFSGKELGAMLGQALSLESEGPATGSSEEAPTIPLKEGPNPDRMGAGAEPQALGAAPANAAAGSGPAADLEPTEEELMVRFLLEQS